MRSPLLAFGALALAASGCGVLGNDADDADGSPVATPVPTISGVGLLPDTVAPGQQPLVMLTRPVNEDGTSATLIGELATGNRILFIGDSILASTSSRHGGQLCDVLVPLGWVVEVEAEISRFVDFGNKVLDRFDFPELTPIGVPPSDLGDDDWDAAVVFLGSNYGGDPIAYEEELREILARLAPRPTLLLTVTEFRSNWAEVNEVVKRLGVELDNVTILDWEEIAQAPGVISGDRQHPTDAGREVLAEAIAVTLGPGSIGEGDCLRSLFTDDSAVNGGGSSSTGSSGSSGGGSSSGSNSGGSSTPVTTSAPSNPGATTAPTSPPATDPPATDPPATSPPATSPPATSPPATSPPATSPPATSPPATSPEDE